MPNPTHLWRNDTTTTCVALCNVHRVRHILVVKYFFRSDTSDLTDQIGSVSVGGSAFIWPSTAPSSTTRLPRSASTTDVCRHSGSQNVPTSSRFLEGESLPGRAPLASLIQLGADAHLGGILVADARPPLARLVLGHQQVQRLGVLRHVDSRQFRGLSCFLQVTTACECTRSALAFQRG